MVATVRIPQWPALVHDTLNKKFSIVLDGIQDPGNMGTIIRTADWYGIENIICSDDCVEVYNPKVVQATMGSLSRMNVHYVDLASVLADTKLPVYGALLDGENIYNTDFGAKIVFLRPLQSSGQKK